MPSDFIGVFTAYISAQISWAFQIYAMAFQGPHPMQARFRNDLETNAQINCVSAKP